MLLQEVEGKLSFPEDINIDLLLFTLKPFIVHHKLCANELDSHFRTNDNSDFNRKSLSLKLYHHIHSKSLQVLPERCQYRIFHFSTEALCISSCNMARAQFFFLKMQSTRLKSVLYQISKIITCLLSRGFSSVSSIFKIEPRPLRCFEVGMKVHANKFCQTSNSFSAKNMFNS